MNDSPRFYGTRPEILPDVPPAGSVYKGRYRLLEPARAHAMGQGRYEHVATFDIETCQTKSAVPGADFWGADADSVDWGTVLIPSAKQRICPSRHNDGSLCCHDAGHAGHHESQSTGNRYGWSDTRSPSGSQIMVAIGAGDTPQVIAANLAGNIYSIRPDLRGVTLGGVTAPVAVDALWEPPEIPRLPQMEFSLPALPRVMPLSQQTGEQLRETARLVGVAVKPVSLGGARAPASPYEYVHKMITDNGYLIQGTHTTNAADILTFTNYAEVVAHFGESHARQYRYLFRDNGCAPVKIVQVKGTGGGKIKSAPKFYGTQPEVLPETLPAGTAASCDGIVYKSIEPTRLEARGYGCYVYAGEWESVSSGQQDTAAVMWESDIDWSSVSMRKSRTSESAVSGFGVTTRSVPGDPEPTSPCEWCTTPGCTAGPGSTCRSYRRCLGARLATGGANNCAEERESVRRWLDAQQETWPENPFRKKPTLCSECSCDLSPFIAYQDMAGKPYCRYCYDSTGGGGGEPIAP